MHRSPPFLLLSGVLLLLLTVAVRSYECDPGRTNSSARTPCAGWSNGDTNRTLCEVELGCCYLVDGNVCFTPVDYRPPDEPLPRITNTQLQWLGFFGQPAEDQSSYKPAEQATFANFGCASDFPTLQAGAALGMTSLFKTQLYLIDGGSRNKGGHQGHLLFPDWQDRWAVLSKQLQPWVANGTISGFHVGDELCWGGLPYSNMSAVATAIGNTAWPGAEARLKKAPLILYVNEGAGTFVRDRNCFNVSIGYTHVPAAIDWISFDFYNPPGSYVKTEYEQYLYPKMAVHQKALLVPDASTSLHIGPKVVNGSASGWAIPDMVARAHEYFAWAATDTSGKIIGINPWHWKTFPFAGPGQYWELGAEDIPALRTVWTAIGKAILANKKKQKQEQ